MYKLEDASSLLKLANELNKFVKENKLASGIQGKKYLAVEAWGYLYAQLQINPIVVNVESATKDGVTYAKSEVELRRLSDNAVVGRGIATCSNSEPSKKSYQPYAIISMAQTRATGKAGRNVFGWIAKAAGYEATPQEEMDDVELSREKPANQLGKQTAETFEQPTESAASVKQKTDILLLLNNAVISTDEKNKMIEGMNKMTQERAASSIEKLEKTILERTTKLRQELHDLITEQDYDEATMSSLLRSIASMEASEVKEQIKKYIIPTA